MTLGALAPGVAHPVPASAATTGSPHWVVSTQGTVWSVGGAPNYGSVSGKLTSPIIGIAPTATRKGYWLVAADGGIFSFGDAGFFGSMGGQRLNAPIVGMAPTSTGNGYWMFAGDGGIFSFGDAAFYGSTGNLRLNQPIIAMSATASGKGYWLLASDGGVFTFGDATFHGSTGAMHLNQPVVGMAPSSDGKGYWLVASDGGIFSFDVPFQGSLGSAGLRIPVTSMLTMPVKSGSGYWLVTSDGTATGFGAAASSTATSTGTTTSTGTSTGTVTTPAKPPMYGVVLRVKTRGEAAVNFALGQIGKPYLWGGNGPDSYDCSGLTKAAWSTVGITLPRVANDQYDFGTKVPLDQLLPGDLVFYADDLTNTRSIHHVAIYLGDGSMVEAPYTGANVRISTVQRDDLMPFGVRPAS